MATLGGIFLIGGIVLIFAGMVEHMFRTNAGPPPNGCGLFFLFIFGIIATKLGRIGIICFMIGSLIMSLANR